jgi:hypothetical protein
MRLDVTLDRVSIRYVFVGIVTKSKTGRIYEPSSGAGGSVVKPLRNLVRQEGGLLLFAFGFLLPQVVIPVMMLWPHM